MVSESSITQHNEAAVGASTLSLEVSAATLHAQTLAMNEALILGALHQHELTEAAEIANARLFVEITERKAAESEIRKLHAELEQRVKERTAELRAANSLLVKEIAERKQAECELIKACQTADEANSAKSAFLARMSHEIRTPMNGITGVTYLLQQTELTGKQRDYTSKIEFSAQNLMGILKDILDFSKIEAGKVELENVAFDLQELLSRQIELMSVLAQQKSLHVKLTIAESTPMQLVGDPLRLGQILTNLISNAIKFTEHGEVEVAVATVERSAASVQLEFKIRDTGIGIHAHQLHKLFKPFSQTDTSTTRRFGGTGLGLVIAERFVQLMGGRITVQSKPDAGSTFSFTARFRCAAAKPPVTGHVHSAQIEPAAQGTRILLVEDNELNQEVAVQVLQLAGYDTIVAASGEDALTILKDDLTGLKFAAVLMDIRMPGLDGYATTQLIRKDNRFERLPIIAMTGDAVSDTRARCLAAGMNDYITKPINIAVLYTTLNKWIKQPL